jgi:hypothetical protein
MDRHQIASLKQRLKSEYEKNLEAIERVEKLLAVTSDPQVQQHQPVIAEVADVQAPAPTAPTLSGEVENWFRWFPDQTWTVKRLVEKMRERAFEFTSEDPHKSVHTAVWRLEKNGVIRTVVRGVGRRPSTYQLAPNAQNRRDDAQPIANGAPTPQVLRHGAPVPVNLR